MTAVSFISWATGVLLVSARLAMVFIATPPFAGIPVPAMARVLLVFSLAAGMVGTIPPLAIRGLDVFSLASALVCEAVIGAVFSAGLFAAFSAFQFAGRLLDMQIGFGVASLVDIATRNNQPLLGAVLSMMAAVFFFAIDGHLALLRLIHLSLEKLPPGGGIGSLDIGAVVAQFATCFSFGLMLVAPVVLCLLIIDLGMAFMSRTMPLMNVFVMSLSLKVLVGLVVLAIALPMAGGAVQRVFDSTFNLWHRVLA